MVSHFCGAARATQTVGYFIEWSSVSFFLMTDARATDEAIEYARKADTVVVESQLRLGMLIRRPLPPRPKDAYLPRQRPPEQRRMRLRHPPLLAPGLKNLFLCHLSENNNTPSPSLRLRPPEALRSIRVTPSAKDITNLQTLPRTHASQLFLLGRWPNPRPIPGWHFR